MKLICAQNIYRSFGTGRLTTEILHDISICVPAGEFLGIMGKSGAGKSTLLYQLSLLDTPTTGSITVADTDVLALTEAERTTFRLETLGYVFQDYALVAELTAAENVMLPLLMRGDTRDEAFTAACKTLDSVGLDKKYASLPNELSGGEKQRVSIARAIVGNPKILFADEPTANLDTGAGTQVINLLTQFNREQGQTIIMVTHEREYATNCHRLLHMEDGRIVNEEQLH